MHTWQLLHEHYYFILNALARQLIKQCCQVTLYICMWVNGHCSTVAGGW